MTHMTLPGRIIGFASVILVALAGACGSDGGSGGSCKMLGSCGGDIVGNWTVTSSCLKLSGPLGDSDCPSATVDANLSFTGTASFTAGLTYTLTFNGGGSETILFPASCLTANGVTTTCDQLNDAFDAEPLGPPVSSVHCTPAGGGNCNCVATLSGTLIAESGTYSTAGSTLTTTTTGEAPSSGPYCVKGNTLDLTSSTPPSSMVHQSGGATLRRM